MSQFYGNLTAGASAARGGASAGVRSELGVTGVLNRPETLQECLMSLAELVKRPLNLPFKLWRPARPSNLREVNPFFFPQSVKRLKLCFMDEKLLEAPRK